MFPPPPARLVGRNNELRVLVQAIRDRGVKRLALVGGGGSGKSLLACALGHRLRRHFPGGVHWLRVGNWDPTTLFEMLSRRLGVARPAEDSDPFRAGPRRIRRLVAALTAAGNSLVVLDNHENDRSLSRFLEDLRAAPVTWVVTARRCLLSGVEIFPVVPPLATARQSAFPRVSALTVLLRWNPLALDIADALVGSGVISLPALRTWLVKGGVERVAPMMNEDDVVEVRLLVDWAWAHLPAGARRLLAVLAHCEGDDMDVRSLARIAREVRGAGPALARLERFRLVQQPLAGRYTVHAVVRQAVSRRARVPRERYFRHYVALLERHPDRVDLEQTHLYAAMDHANATSDLDSALRLERLLARLDG
jgi:NB-ARC domain